MAVDAGNAVLGEIAKAVIKPAVDAIFRHCGYLVNFNTNIDNLKQEAKDLESKRLDAMKVFKLNENNNQERTKASDDWLTKIEGAKKAADGVMEDSENLKTWCWCPNPIKRYRLGKKAFKVAARIHQLESYVPTSTPALPAAQRTGGMANNLSNDYKSRAEIMKKIMEALEDDKISIIGVCGSGGVGKTTLMHELRERVIVDGLFNEVAMAVVSETPDLLSIQHKLAEMLGLTSVKDEKNEIAVADAIHERLTRKERKTLVILDDIWGEINLVNIGIPVGSAQPQCKVIMTSRNSHVCNKMNSQKNISVETMPPDEAWNLFKKKAGNYVESDDLKKIAEEVAQECGGLPIALVTVAGALHDKKTIEIWKDALKQLKDHRVTTIEGMERKVYMSIKLSYDSLAREVPEAKLLLFLCCQHPEDAEINVESLVRYCLALRLFKNVETLCDTRNRVTSLMEQLKGRFLLEAVDVDDYNKKCGLDRVKMHDIVRHVGCSIVSSSNEERERVYMHINNGKKAINGGYEVGASEADYKNLKILVHSNIYADPMEGSFLSKIDELRVLEYVWKGKDEAVSVEDVSKLRMLRITVFLRGKIWSKIGSLNELEILESFCYDFEMFPDQIKQLTHLKLLDLRCIGMFENLVPITKGILPELKNLEMLYLGKFYFKVEPGESDASITELSMLPNLMSLQIQLVSPMQLLHLPMKKLERFDVFLSTRKEKYSRVTRKRALIASQTRNPLIWRTLRGKGLGMNLAEIDGSWIGMFSKLEYLYLRDMNELTILCQNGNLPLGSFGNLRILDLYRLPKLRHFLVGPTDPLCLVYLQELTVNHCEMLEGIVSKGDGKPIGKGEIKEEGATDFILHFPNLRKVKITSAGRFGGLCNVYEKDSLVQPLVHPRVMLPSLESLYVCGSHQLKQIVAGSNTDLQNLQRVTVGSCNSLESVFDFDRFEVTNDDALFLLGELQAIKLDNLPNLEHICRLPPKGIHIFQKLTKLSVDYCASLNYLLPSSVAQSLVSLEHLIIRVCKSMSECISVGEEHSGEKIVFRSLKSITLKRMRKLSSFCSSDQHEFEFPSLEKVDIFGCPQMKTFCYKVTAHKLKEVETYRNVISLWDIDRDVSGDVESVWKNDLNETIRHINERTLKDWDDLLDEVLCCNQIKLPTMEILKVGSTVNLRHIVGAGNIDIHEIFASNWLRNLREVNISSSETLESVFNFEEMQFMVENAHVVTLGELQKISLKWLDNLACIFRCRIQDISIPKLQDIEIYRCNKLVNLFESTFIKLLQSLRQVKIEHCEAMETVFDFEGLEVMSKESNVMLGELQQIEVERLPKLQHICRLPPKEVFVFQNLTKLDVRRCDSLNYLISSSVAQSLVNLESLYIMECKSMRECIRMEEKDYSGKKIVFRSLKSIELNRLEELSSFCASDRQVFEFPSLERLLIIDCPELKTFCFGLMTAEKLHGVEFGKGKSVWMTNLNETVRHFNTSDKEKVVSDSNANNQKNIRCDNEGTSFPNASLASSSSPTLIDHVLSSSTELHDSSRNDYPKEDDLVAAVAAVDNVTRDGDGGDNTQDNPASVETNASPPSEIFLNEALPLSDTSMKTKSEKDLFDSMSNCPDDDQKQSETLIQGVHVEDKLRTNIKEMLKEEQTPSRPPPLETLEHETAVPASPHDVTLSSIKAKQPLLPTYIQASTSQEENKAELQELKKKVNEITSQIGSHGSKLESIDAHLTALISQLITSQQSLQTQLSRLLHTHVSELPLNNQTLLLNTTEGEDTENKADLQKLKKKVDENTAQIGSHGSKLESIDAHLAALKSLMDTMVEEMKKKHKFKITVDSVLE